MVTSLKLFNSSVISMQCSLGWGGSPSELRLETVEDTRAGEVFTPQTIGTSVYLNYGGFSFGGLIQSYGAKQGSEGFINNVVIVSPNELLAGVSLIIGGYYGTIGSVVNIYNIFGLVETSLGYGGSQSNESGIPWHIIRDGFITLQSTYPIKFQGENYTVDFSYLPSLPNYYRIGGESISLLDFISEVCEAASCDFFIRLVYPNVITIHTVSRASQPTLGYIASFISSLDGVSSKDVGRELRMETTSKFLVGGNKAELYFSLQNSGSTDSFEDDLIYPFWGLQRGDNPYSPVILGNGAFDENHSFSVDSRAINAVGIGDSYSTNVEEMRVALIDQEAWESLLWYNNGLPTKPQYGRAVQIGCNSDLRVDIDTFLESRELREFDHLTPLDFAPWHGTIINNASKSIEDLSEENISEVYNFVNGIASQFYGRKYMVRLPDVLGKWDADTNTLTTSVEPTDGAYIPEIYFSGAIVNNLLPANYDNFLLEDGRLQSYARYDNYTNYDFSDISTEDYVIWGSSLFVRTFLDDRLYFLNPTGLQSPRAVINVPGLIRYKDPKVAKRDTAIMYKSIYSKAYAKAKTGGASDADADITAKAKATKLLSRLGSESVMMAEEALVKMPDFVAIPLKSNVDFYGPWYSIGVDGKTEFEKDDTLVPWNYGGYAQMNLAANARVSEALSSFIVGEGGSVEVPGMPARSLGDVLITNGPYITDISINFGQGGVTTTYRMQTWTPRFGKLSKAYQDRIKDLGIARQKDRKVMRELSKLPPPGAQIYNARKSIVEGSRNLRRRKPSSTMQVIAGEFLGRGSGLRNHVVMAPMYNIIQHIGSGYENKAVASFDTLFRPFDTNTGATDVPHFEINAANGPSSSTLNPFGDDDFKVVTRGSALPSGYTHLNDAEGYARALGMRFPMIGVGWGYDIDGNPVPGVSGQFEPDYKTRPDLWKVGPVDFRWNNSRKVWQSPLTNIVKAVSSGIIPIDGSGLAIIYRGGIPAESVSAHLNWMHHEIPISGGTEMLLMYFEDEQKYVVIGAECP